MPHDLSTLGWRPADDYYLELARQGYGDKMVPCRVASAHTDRCTVLTAEGLVQARWPRPLPMLESADVERPAVGDWGVTNPTGDLRTLTCLLPRRSTLARGVATGARATQVIAANLDLILIVSGLDQDYNPARLERYLALARSSGAASLVLLNKADIACETAAQLKQVQALAREVPVLLISARAGNGLDQLQCYLTPGSTAVLIGSSGAGKSTLLNSLLGAERQRTNAVRADDDRGRHTTTSRELLTLPTGALVIDTPGLREVGLLGDQAALDEVFGDIATIAAGCRFTDCNHAGEPDCAVSAAILAGELDQARVSRYRALRLEAENATRRADTHAQRTHERHTVGKYRDMLKEAQRFKGR